MDLKVYSQNISNFIAGSYITSAITLGKDLGLFDELKRLDKPVSSQQLADACNLKERYVREWLGCMVSTRIVFLDDSDKYFIPQSLKPGLDSTGFAFLFPVISTMTDKVKNCFRNDGPQGYDWSEMPNKLIDVTEDKTPDPDKAVEQLLVPVTKSIKSMTAVLDLGCGAGVLTRALSRHCPDADIYGVDYNEGAITKAKANAESQSIKNVTFVTEDATSLPADWTGKFDWVILFDVLHDLPDHVNAMKEVRRVLKDDGVVSITDPDLHSNQRDNVGDPNVAGVGYAISTMICLPCSLSIDGAPGYGMGWGTEKKEAFLSSSGWRVKDKSNIQSSFALNFTCVKASKET
ncbi:uncharacterized protein LOC110451808 [Mizuhopecten yessoensis]|uniref:Demethylmenaquinone methyltransferase n=1 Tax=Mizuhopecten yessoensis TaxID=6573 RepID=A0A210QL08_MIZYE|nr:uncharacterized protein LOC110451808 [Mizuhopecten yessoensis]OWF49424.1 Demethylmenaquinone methyltransferase [Mizuhopecten yessoensis]